MVGTRFLAWCERASVAERRELALRAADLATSPRTEPAQAGNAAAILGALAGDLSPQVRVAIAERLAGDERAPRSVLRILSDDVDAAAVPIAALSPVLRDGDLQALAITGSEAVRRALARRRPVNPGLSLVLAETGEATVGLELLSNDAAVLDARSLCLIRERHGAAPGIAVALLERDDLPSAERLALLLSAGRSLEAMPLVRETLGSRAGRVCAEACESGTVAIAETMPVRNLADYAGHLRRGGRISTAFLIRTACGGDLDLFAASVATLCGQPAGRVRAVIVDAREGPFRSLLAQAGVPAPAIPLLLLSVRLWKAEAMRPAALAERDPAAVLQLIADRYRAQERGEEAHGLELILARLLAEAARRPRRPLRLAA